MKKCKALTGLAVKGLKPVADLKEQQNPKLVQVSVKA